MPPGLKSFLRRWFVTTLGVLVASKVFPEEIHADTFQTLLTASLLLGICNALLRPVLMILALPVLIITLGLFTFIINASLLYFVSWTIKPFVVESFWSAFKASIVIGVISLLTNLVIGKEVKPESPNPAGAGPALPNAGRKPHSRPEDDGGGPIIDV